MNPNRRPKARFLTQWLPAAALVALSTAAHAGGGEALDIEAPSMRTPIEQTSGIYTRAEVKEILANARMAGTLSRNGEAGDTPEVLAARDNFNALQAEVLSDPARYAVVEDAVVVIVATGR